MLQVSGTQHAEHKDMSWQVTSTTLRAEQPWSFCQHNSGCSSSRCCFRSGQHCVCTCRRLVCEILLAMASNPVRLSVSWIGPQQIMETVSLRL